MILAAGYFELSRRKEWSPLLAYWIKTQKSGYREA
jgi:hypothetical protein